MTKKSNEKIDAEIEESKHLYNRGKILSKLYENVDREDALEFEHYIFKISSRVSVPPPIFYF